MHRLLVTSRAYRMSSHEVDADVPNVQRDPENVAYWRFNATRMESEVVRDGLLATAGVLDPAIGGPDIDFNQGFVSRRRSLYLTHHGEGRMPFLELFDAPDACEAYTRTVSVVPQQSLALTNNELARSLALIIASKLGNESASSSSTRFVEAAFEQVLCRKPTTAELERSLAFLDAQARLFASTIKDGQERAGRARGNLVLVLFNHHDFLTVH